MGCQYFDPVLKRWSSRGMYIRSLHLNQLTGNQRGTIGLLMTCISHHMTDFQFAMPYEDEFIKTNELNATEGIALFEKYDKNKVLVPLLQIVLLVIVIILSVVAQNADNNTKIQVEISARERFLESGEIVSGKAVRLALLEAFILPC